MDLNKKIEQLIAGNVRAAAQLITHIENQNKVQEIISTIYPYKKESYIIGITGAPGVGKSTIIDKLIDVFDNKSDPLTISLFLIKKSQNNSGRLF